MPSDAEIAWAAGIFEGEGCISLSPKHNGVMLKIESTDRDIIERFYSIVRLGSVRFDRANGPDAELLGFKPIHIWQACTFEDCIRVLRLIYDWLGERRKAKADEAFARTVIRRIDWTHCPSGHEYSEENTYIVPSTGGRRCRECQRRANTEYYRRKRAAVR